MAECCSTLTWQRGGAVQLDNCYVRTHAWECECGCEVATGSTVQVVVPGPKPRARMVSSAEAFVASLSRTHMMQFLAIAARRGFCVESYTDVASGLLKMGAKGLMAVTKVTLKPYAVFYGEYLPTSSDIEAMHREAHEESFLSNAAGA